VANVSEQHIAGVVVTYLQQLGWDVYQEVQVNCGGNRADIVAVQGPVVRVIEVKTSFTAALLEQAWFWTNYANLVHVAVPTEKTSSRVRGRSILKHFCREQGIGVYGVDEAHKYIAGEYQAGIRVTETEGARLRRRVGDHLRSSLREEHKEWGEAGNAHNRYWTPFKGTCEAWRRHVEAHPGCTLKEIVAAVDHHYASDKGAKSSMINLIERGVVPGIEARRDGRAWTLWPKKDPPRVRGRGRAPQGEAQ